jgi:hypothetical protein
MNNKQTTPEIANVPETTNTKDVITLPENLTGKKLSALTVTKIGANKDYKTSEGSISKMLKNYIEFGGANLSELNKRYNTTLTADYIKSCIESGADGVKIFTKYLTEKEKIQSDKRGAKIGKTSPVYTFWVLSSLIARYCQANKVKK